MGLFVQPHLLSAYCVLRRKGCWGGCRPSKACVSACQGVYHAEPSVGAWSCPGEGRLGSRAGAVGSGQQELCSQWAEVWRWQASEENGSQPALAEPAAPREPRHWRGFICSFSSPTILSKKKATVETTLTLCGPGRPVGTCLKFLQPSGLRKIPRAANH